MNNEKVIEKLKKQYLSIQPPKKLVESGWVDLSKRIGEGHFLFARPFAFATLTVVLVLIASVGTAVASNKALPGEPLYPIKRLVENVSQKLSPNPHTVIERRADEIIDLSKKEEKKKPLIEEAAKEYKEAVREVEKDVEKKGESEEAKKEFEEKLNEHKKRFEEAVEEQSVKEELKKTIEEAQKKSEASREQVHGIMEKVEKEKSIENLIEKK